MYRQCNLRYYTSSGRYTNVTLISLWNRILFAFYCILSVFYHFIKFHGIFL